MSRKTFTVNLAPLGFLGAPISDEERAPALATFYATATALELGRIERAVASMLGVGLDDSYRRTIAEARAAVAVERDRLLAERVTASAEEAWALAWAKLPASVVASAAFADAQIRACDFLARWSTLWVDGPADARELASLEVTEAGLATVRAAFEAAAEAARAGNVKPSAG